MSPNYSNWELSVDRANTARKILVENGLRKDQVQEVRGFADQRLRRPENPMDFSNRRVSILVPASHLRAPSSANLQREGKDGGKKNLQGMTPQRMAGPGGAQRRSRASRKARMTLGRVSRGSITSSMLKMPAAG